MTTISTFPTIPSAIFGSYISFTGKASTTIKVGQIVISDPSSAGYYKPAPANGAFGGLTPAGVSASDCVAPEDFTIITSGIAYVGNSDDSAAIARGASVKIGAYPGAVALATSGDTVVGIVLGDGIPANGYGRIKLASSMALNNPNLVTGNLQVTGEASIGGVISTEVVDNERWYNDLPIGPYHIRKEQILKVGVTGAWDSLTINDPWLIRKGDTYYLFFGGYDGTHARVGFATSQNLVDWTKYASNPVFQEGASGEWDDKFASKAAILKIGSTYYMYYEGMNVAGTKGIGVATSTDLITWTKSLLNPVLSPGLEPGAETTVNILAPSMFEKNGIYYMFYDGQPNGTPDFRWRAYYATSIDGITWTKRGKILDVTPGEWDAGWVGAPSVIRSGKYYIMAYCASSQAPPSLNNEPPPEGMGMGYSTDLITWTKSTDNPIMVSESWRQFVKLFWRPHLVSAEGKTLMFFNAAGTAHEEIFIAVPEVDSLVPDIRNIELQGYLFSKGVCLMDASDGHSVDWATTAICGAKWICNAGLNHGINTIGDPSGNWRVQTEEGIGHHTYMHGLNTNYLLRDGGLGLYTVFRNYSNVSVYEAVGFADELGGPGPYNQDCILIAHDTRTSPNYIMRVARAGVVKDLDTGVIAPGNMMMKWELRQTSSGMDVFCQDALVLQIASADLPATTTNLRKMIRVDNLDSAVLNWLDFDCFIPFQYRWCEV